jgi:threonine dehydrogenase-like Zn-dependent dehydrogenase
MHGVYPRATRLVAAGRVDAGSVVTASYPLDRVGDAFTAAAARRGLKTVVTPT